MPSESIAPLFDAADIAAVRQPLAAASFLPPKVYSDPRVFAFEKQAMFRRTWLPVCHVSQIPEAGDYFARKLFDEPVIVDSERILRALQNVADNACKAMASGGGTLTLRSAKDGDRLVFELADTGEGMAPEVLAHVFEPFYSASGQGGTGLGMLIVKNIVEAHGGCVSLSSEQGKGTSVFLALPLHP